MNYFASPAIPPKSAFKTILDKGGVLRLIRARYVKDGAIVIMNGQHRVAMRLKSGALTIRPYTHGGSNRTYINRNSMEWVAITGRYVIPAHYKRKQ